jgi:dihydrodipicolinate synthase/N-acetylneuraminate lyase
MGENRRTTKLSAKCAKAALAQLLSGCRDDRLAGFTAAGLSGSYNVSPAEAEKMLAAARSGRGL